MVGIESQLQMNGINGYICMKQTRVNVQCYSYASC